MRDANGAAVLRSRLARLGALASSSGLDPEGLALPAPFEAWRAAASSVQRRLWFAEQFQGQVSAYQIPLALRLRGPIDLAVLDRAVQRVVDRHDTLRARLVDEGGMPVMDIAPWSGFHLDVRPLGTCDDADAREQFLASARPFIEERFDLAAAPPWRAALFERTSTDAFLLLVFHHTIFDGASINVLVAELAGAYDDEQRGAVPRPDPERWQYPEFAAWQHAREAAGALEADVEFWARTLAGAPDGLQFAGDRGRASTAVPVRGDVVRQVLAPRFAARLAEAAASEQATTFVAGLALWCAWLRRQTGHPDIVIGTPTSGRSLAVFEPLIGPCINTLALRLDTSAARTYSALVRLASHVVREARAHEHAPVDRVLHRLRPERAAGRTPIAQTSFTSPAARKIPQFGGLAVERVHPPIPGAKSDVGLEIARRADHWAVGLEYNEAVLSPEGARDALADFLSFSESVLEAPDQPLEGRLRPRRRRAPSDLRRDLPLTPSQHRMWVDQAKAPGAPIYNVPVTIEIHGPIDEEAFEGAFARLVAGNDSLRLRFSAEGGEPRQRVSDLSGRVARLDFRDVGDQERKAWLAREIAAPFDLSVVAFRCTLVRVDDARHLLVFVQHHLIGDGFSAQLLAERMSDLYARDCRGDKDAVAFPSFAAYVAEMLDECGAVAESRPGTDAAWWERQFDGVERPRFFGLRPQKTGTRVTRSDIQLAPEAAEAFAVSTRAGRGASPEQAALMTAASALVALLYRMTGERRIALGLPYHNRGRGERHIAGPFMDVLPIAIDCASGDTLADLAQRVAVSLRQTLRHARSLPPPAVRERSCDVLLNVQSVARGEFCGAPARRLWVHPGHERESLALQVLLAGDTATFHLDTHDDVFDAGARARMAARFERVLSQALRAPGTPLADLALVDDEEMDACLAAGRGPVVDGARATPVLTAISSAAAAAPEAIAVEDGAASVTYASLVERAARVARSLADRGIARGDLVGVCLPRGADYIAAILGVLGAGAAYLPLDPADPSPRRDACLAVASARLVITDVAPLMQAPPMPFVERSLDDLAYVIFTSGSTGNPKGVEICDGSLANYTAFAVSRFRLTRADRALQFAALTFDTAVEEIFPALEAGATLVLRDDAMLASPEAFVRAIEARRISVVNLPTSYWHGLAAADARMPACTRLVIVGGEDMRPLLLARWHAANGARVQLLNGYGPTEATVVATMGEPAPQPGGSEPVSIGTVIWNAEAHVVDACGRIVPVGHAGELLIGGAGLARGYRNDPAATAARFVAHPLDPTARVYRTGDRARMRQDGAFEFLGRLDDQIKVRGYRVEPGEIEARLREYPGIADAAVIAQPVNGAPALQAFLVGERTALDAAGVRAHLRECLPEYMLPQAYFVMPELPRTSSGKPDPSRFPSCARPLEGPASSAPPETPLQAEIAAAWNAVLGRASTGIHENFFDAGGHSLLATQVVARLSSELKTGVPLKAVFDHPTIAGLAAFLEGEHGALVPAVAPPLEHERGPFPLSFAQQRIWFAEQLVPGTRQFTVPSLLRLSGVLDTGALQRALDALAARHAALRTTFLTDGDVPRQRVDAAGALILEHVDPAGDSSCADTLARDFFARRFDLERGPLVRAGVVRIHEREHWLLFSFHHLIVDGWSSHILIEDLSALYAAETRREPARLAAPGGEYASFVRWQQEQLAGDGLRALVGYWRAQLDGLAELRLPPDGPGGGDAWAGIESLTLDASTVARLTRAATDRRVTPFVISAAALALVLARWSGQDDVVFGMPVAGRTRPEYERTVGLFLNTLPMRITVAATDTVDALIARARESALGAFAHQDLPFEQMIEALAPERSASRHPFFDVVLNFVNTPQASVSLEGLEIAPLDAPLRDAKHPLTIYVVPREGRLVLRGVYRRTMFDAGTIAALLDAFGSVLGQFVDAPTRLVEEVTLVTRRTRRLIADPAAPLPARNFESVAERFARACEEWPDALAIDDGRRPMTYAEASAAAAAVQRYLDASEVPREAAVAITGRMSSRYVAALIGILGSGRVAVPLDADAPVERSRIMAAQAAVAAILDVDRGFPVCDTGARLAPAPSSDRAYIMFTSGSTGVPKAIVGSHRGLSHFVAWESRTIGVTPADRVARVTPPTFDVFLREVFVPLTAGASLHIAAEAEGAVPANTLEWLDRVGITIVHAVPTLAQFWMTDRRAPERLPALRWTLFAGEALSSAVVERWRAIAPGTRVLNLYGPTETTLAKCWHEVPRDCRAQVVPVGRAMDGAQAFVMRGGALCGIGEIGEVVIRTPYRSHGYRNHSEAAARFVANPFTSDPDDVLYRTGDRGRCLPDGTLTISGRVDDAVKIRGVRVDTAEAAAVLNAHPQVRAAAVVADFSRDEPCLVACVVREGDVPANVLRGHVERRLSSAARPSTIVFVDAIPRTANGKVDRNAVLALSRTTDAPTSDDQPPATATERGLAAIWCALLSCAAVARHSDFFDLGGHSLLAARLVAEIRRTFAVDLPLRTVFDAPTLSGLAAAIDGRRRETGPEPAPIPRADRSRFRAVPAVIGGVE